MYTVIETPIYAKMANRLLAEREREALAAFIAGNPTAGAVVRSSGGVRKVRWGRGKRGRSGGVRVIYHNRLEIGEIWLLTIYGKNDRSTIPASELKAIKEALDNE